MEWSQPLVVGEAVGMEEESQLLVVVGVASDPETHLYVPFLDTFRSSCIIFSYVCFYCHFPWPSWQPAHNPPILPPLPPPPSSSVWPAMRPKTTQCVSCLWRAGRVDGTLNLRLSGYQSNPEASSAPGHQAMGIHSVEPRWLLQRAMKLLHPEAFTSWPSNP